MVFCRALYLTSEETTFHWIVHGILPYIVFDRTSEETTFHWIVHGILPYIVFDRTSDETTFHWIVTFVSYAQRLKQQM